MAGEGEGEGEGKGEGGSAGTTGMMNAIRSFKPDPILVRTRVMIKDRTRVRFTPGIGVCGNTVLATRAPRAIPGSNPSTIGAVAANDLKAEQWGTCWRGYDWPTALATPPTKRGTVYVRTEVSQPRQSEHCASKDLGCR